MSYFITPTLGLQLADPLTIQAFETTNVNSNFMLLESGIATDRGRLTVLETARISNVADLDAMILISASAAEGRILHVDDMGANFQAQDSVWVQVTDAKFTTAAVRDVAYAKAAAAYKVANARAYLTTPKFLSEYPSVGTAWRGAKGSGLTKMVPTVTVATGVSVDDAGTVAINVASGIRVGINVCFTAEFRNYRMIVERFSGSVATEMSINLRQGGVDNTGLAYSNNRNGQINGAAASPTGAVNATTWVIDQTNQAQSRAVLEIYAPADAASTTLFAGNFVMVGTQVVSGPVAGTFTTLLSFDGISLTPNTAGAWLGSVRVYGYND